MTTFCSCATQPQNTGVPVKQRIISDPYKLVLVYLKADDGTLNGISSSDVLDQSYFDALVNHPDPSKRWYPVGPFVSVTDTREDATFEEYSDGSRSVTRKGRRTFQGMVLQHFGKYLAALNSFGCFNLGVGAIDNCGQFYGEESADGETLYPIPINASSSDNLLMKAGDTVAGKVRMQFDYDMIANDEKLRVITLGELGGADLLRLEGLRDVAITTANPSTTGVDATLTLSYDGGPTTLAAPVVGWVPADFAVYNVTTSSTVTVTGATEAPDGTYALTFAAQATNDVLRLRSAKNGFAFEQIVTVP